jgi:hypothetical protein
MNDYHVASGISFPLARHPCARNPRDRFGLVIQYPSGRIMSILTRILIHHPLRLRTCIPARISSRLLHAARPHSSFVCNHQTRLTPTLSSRAMSTDQIGAQHKSTTARDVSDQTDIGKMKVEADGTFKRKASVFRNFIEKGGKFAPERDRYHLYVSYACREPSL